MKIPESEINYFRKLILSQPEYLDPKYLTQQLQALGLTVNADPFSHDNIDPIKEALTTKTPFSVIRIGDGEANMLSYKKDPNTPSLDQVAFQEIIDMQQDSFVATPVWMTTLSELMTGTLFQADIIGVTGIWRPSQPTVTEIADRFTSSPRAISGHWRAISLILKLSSKGFFKNKVIASAHLYFSILNHLDQLIHLARKVIIISNHQNLVKKLENIYPKVQFTIIPVGSKNNLTYKNDSPTFLSKVFASLPMNMSNKLALIGAGPWSEIYCSWIKQRGGVAIDIGSGFDLLDGQLTRPVHKKIHHSIIKKYAL